MPSGASPASPESPYRLVLASASPRRAHLLEQIGWPADLIVSLSPEAQHRAVEMTRTMAAEIEFWNTMDPSIVEGHREARLEAYRQVRDGLMARIQARFPLRPTPIV